MIFGFGLQLEMQGVGYLQDVAMEFKVKAMPTFVLLKNGKEVDRVVGADKVELEKKILKHKA